LRTSIEGAVVLKPAAVQKLDPAAVRASVETELAALVDTCRAQCGPQTVAEVLVDALAELVDNEIGPRNAGCWFFALAANIEDCRLERGAP
jgi:hypothetical protein